MSNNSGETAKKHWWELPVRMMRIDYAPDFAQIRNFDLEELVKKSREEWRINCEWIVGSMSFEGRSYETTFATKEFASFPGFEDFDYLRTYTPIAHEKGLRVISYLNMHWYKYEFAAEHPGWEQLTSTGEAYGKIAPLYGNGTTLCVNTPWREWAFRMIREAGKTGVDGILLDGPVIYPDCCYCDTCRALFKEKYGADIPKEDWRNPLWKKFIEFREYSLAHFLEDARKALKEVNPEGVIFLNTGGWTPQSWRVARDVQKVAPYQDFNLSEAFFHYGEGVHLYSSLIMGKYIRMANNPGVVATHYMNGRWHYLLLPPNELKLALIQTLASGSNPWIAIVNSSLESQPDGPKPVGEIFGFMEDHDEYYTDTESIADVGLLFSTRTSTMYLSKFEEVYKTAGGKEENLVLDMNGKDVKEWNARKQHCENLLVASDTGYFSALTRNHVLFDILLDDCMTKEGIAKYKTLILPDSACLTEKESSLIEDFVRDGGNLIASFESGFYDEIGEYTERLFNLLGIKSVDGAFKATMGENYGQAVEEHLGFQKGKLLERGPYVLKVKPADGAEVPEVLYNPIEGAYVPLKGLSEYPGLVINKFGKGKVAYYPEAVGNFYGNTGMISTETRIAGMAAYLNGKSEIEVEAPKTISVDAYRQSDKNRIVIHLVNNTIDGRPVNEFIPVYDVKIKVSAAAEPKEVKPLRENKSLDTEYSDGCCVIRIPKLSEYEVIAITF